LKKAKRTIEDGIPQVPASSSLPSSQQTTDSAHIPTITEHSASSDMSSVPANDTNNHPSAPSLADPIGATDAPELEGEMQVIDEMQPPPKTRRSNLGELLAPATNRYNTRSKLNFQGPVHPGAFKLSVSKALKGENAEAARRAIIDEIQNMLDFKVGHYVKLEEIPHKHRRNILRSFMFLKEKTRPDGSFDRVKARLVGDGSTQGKHLYDMISSSTVALTIVFLLFNIATKFRTHLVSYDIKGAFLNAKFSQGDNIIYLRVSPDIASIWAEQDPQASQYLSDKVELYIKLDAFIYGLKQSPLKFQLHLAQTLISIGYQQSISDECLFYKTEGEDFSYLTTHVDDVLQTSTCKKFVKELREKLALVYGTVTFNERASSYLGMSIYRSTDLSEIWVSQHGLVTQLIDSHLPGYTGNTKSPASGALFDMDTTGHTPVDRSRYLSVLMSIMYLARLSRPDILQPTTYLATKSQNPTQSDWNAVIRIIRYLYSTRNHALHIKCNDLTIKAYCDASSGSHMDGSSHTGYCLKMGDSYLAAKSGKQKTGGTSSTDAELIAATDCLKNMVWIQDLLMDIGIQHHQTPVLHQDNQSTIYLLTQRTKCKKVKHLMVKLAYARGLLRDRRFAVKYIPTEHMVADCLTKPKSSKYYANTHAAGLGVVPLPKSSHKGVSS
jgi:hypothetical protein